MPGDAGDQGGVVLAGVGAVATYVIAPSSRPSRPRRPADLPERVPRSPTRSRAEATGQGRRRLVSLSPGRADCNLAPRRSGVVMADLVIRNGTVVDGTGAEPRAPPTWPSTATASSPSSRRWDGRARARSTPTAASSRPASSTSTRTSTPSWLGPAAHVELLARRHQRRDRQLRRHLRAVQPGRPRVPGRDDGERRGHPAPTRSSTACRGTGRPTASTSTGSTASPKGVNVGGMVGHCAVRDHGDGRAQPRRGRRRRPTTSPPCATCVDEAIGAGALGFSTSRTLLHRVPDGRPVPGTFADARRAARHRRRAAAARAGACSRARAASASATPPSS